jgi:pimeloyl-ACP methyl ester carboxylesterase
MTAKVQRSYVDGRQGQMHVRVANPEGGRRAPLVCIHMSPMTGRVFERFLAAMGRDRMAVAFDTPGFGMSDPPPAPPRIEEYAADILSGLDSLGVEGPCDLMGYHTGSLISVAMAEHAPARVRRVIMISAPIFSTDERRTFHEYYAHRTPQADGSHLVARWKGFLYHHLRPGTTIEQAADVFRDALMGGQNEWWGHRAASGSQS